MSSLSEHEAQQQRKSELDKLAYRHVHACPEGVVAGNLSVAWGGYYKRNEYVLVCSNCGPLLDDAPLIKKGTPYDTWKQGGAVPIWMGNAYQKKEEERLMEEHGNQGVKALQKYGNRTDLTHAMAQDIVESLWPKAPTEEKLRAALLCASEHLNPLMKHVYLIPFNEGKPNESWATILSIKAKRLLASRRGAYSYIDETPRVMTADEQKRRFGEVKKGVQVIVKLSDPATGAEVPGFGEWPEGKPVYGTDKGNTAFNMASIRAESMALDRLRPGELPSLLTMDETEIEGMVSQSRVLISEVDQQTGEIKPEPAKTEQVEAEKAVDENLAGKEFANPGQFFQACNDIFNLTKTQVLKEVPEYDLSNSAQRKKAWQAIVAVYQKAADK